MALDNIKLLEKFFLEIFKERLNLTRILQVVNDKQVMVNPCTLSPIQRIKCMESYFGIKTHISTPMSCGGWISSKSEIVLPEIKNVRDLEEPKHHRRPRIMYAFSYREPAHEYDESIHCQFPPIKPLEYWELTLRATFSEIILIDAFYRWRFGKGFCGSFESIVAHSKWTDGYYKHKRVHFERFLDSFRLDESSTGFGVSRMHVPINIIGRKAHRLTKYEVGDYANFISGKSVTIGGRDNSTVCIDEILPMKKWAKRSSSAESDPVPEYIVSFVDDGYKVSLTEEALFKP